MESKRRKRTKEGRRAKKGEEKGGKRKTVAKHKGDQLKSEIEHTLDLSSRARICGDCWGRPRREGGGWGGKRI